jgi:hypothetical protein
MKTKVIAFRVTQDEYDALVYNAASCAMKLGEFVQSAMRSDINEGLVLLAKERKRLEAKAKRDAKKAAANGAQ